jgi:hypothetical protein
MQREPSLLPPPPPPPTLLHHQHQQRLRNRGIGQLVAIWCVTCIELVGPSPALSKSHRWSQAGDPSTIWQPALLASGSRRRWRSSHATSPRFPPSPQSLTLLTLVLRPVPRSRLGQVSDARCVCPRFVCRLSRLFRLSSLSSLVYSLFFFFSTLPRPLSPSVSLPSRTLSDVSI